MHDCNSSLCNYVKAILLVDRLSDKRFDELPDEHSTAQMVHSVMHVAGY
jgi:hypothetical protein